MQKFKLKMLILSMGLALSTSLATAGEHSGKDHTGPYFISPKNGETVSSTFTVVMGIEAMKVHKAGEIIEGTGHHHLIIDGAHVPEHKAVPADKQHIHFGKGQTETEVTLIPGKHTLTLQFANGIHQSYGKKMSTTIEVNVK